MTHYRLLQCVKWLRFKNHAIIYKDVKVHCYTTVSQQIS